MSAARRSALGAAVVVLALVSGACGNDDGDKAASTDHAGHASTTAKGNTPGGSGGDTTATTTPGASSTSSTAADHGMVHETTTTAFKPSQSSDTVPIQARDFTFVGAPATVTGPKVFFTMDNQGPSAHELAVYDADGKPLGVIAPIDKGQKGQLAIELQPGTYSMRCDLKSGTRTHAELGMRATFSVT